MAEDYSKSTNNTINERMRMNSALTWVADMMQLMSRDEVIIPKVYREQVLEIKQLLISDTSGIVNSLMDFAIDSAIIKQTIETPNKNLTKKLNNWLSQINYDLKGQVPVGVMALSKEYYRERWKGSSFLLLRSFWEKKDGLLLPTVMYFVDGEDIIEESDEKVTSLKEKQYYLRINNKEKKRIGTLKNERLFIQKPYSSWGTSYTTPFLLGRGAYKNLKFLDLVEKRAESVVAKALEYMGLLRKGTENLALANNPNFVYDEKDFQKLKQDMSNFTQARKNVNGTSAYITNFDTNFEHIIPEYSKILKAELYNPIERRILASLGFIDVVQGVSSRRESVINPKPFFSEVKQGVEEWSSLLLDVIGTIIELNTPTHRKYFRNDIKIYNPIIKAFITDEELTQLRSGYDRGILSKKTYGETLGVDLEVEIARRKVEEETEDTTYPPIIINQEQYSKAPEVPDNNPNNPIKDEDKDPDKTGPEKKNYIQSTLIDIDDIPNLAMDIGSKRIFQKGDDISIHLNEESYKQKITKQNYSYFKLALISKAVKDFQKEDGWKCNDVLNVDPYSGNRTRPVYSKLPTSRIRTEELLVDGFYCLTRGEDNLVVGVKPSFNSFGVEVYSNNSSGDLADVFIEGFEMYALENNFLNGEKITPQGKFLTIPETSFADVKLQNDKKQAIKIGALEFFKKKDIYAQNKLPFKRGLIFAGEPGTGKTLVGKALMKETNSTFIWVTAKDLTTSYGDIDSQAFGRLLLMAKELAPSVLFAEDIDDYLEAKSSVDTIKTQMDGLDSMDGVVTVLCTNYPERIPKSLIDRPSSFDDVSIFDLPDEGLRYEILDAHLKSVTIKDRASILKKIAKEAVDLTGAHLKEVAVYSILLASDANRNEITEKDFIKALDKIKKTRDLIQTLQEEKGSIQKDLIYEEAPYTRKHYPPQLKGLPSGAINIWIDTFNSVLSSTDDEDQARKAAWSNVKSKYKKSNNKWIKKTNNSL